MKNPLSICGRKAFTLIEMIIAITVFTIFIGFAISAYLTFHRADEDALTNRTLLMDSEAILNELSDATRENKIDYEAYAASSGGDCGSSTEPSSLPSFSLPTFSLPTISLGTALNVQTLCLLSADEQQRTVYSWDAEGKSLSVQRSEKGGALSEKQRLNSEALTMSAVNFRIFPDTDPYAESSEEHYQPMVTFYLSFSMQSREVEPLTLDLRTTVTSRFYK